MTLLLREADVEQLVTMPMALEAVEQGFRLHGENKADNSPRRRCRLERGLFHVMSASFPTLGLAGLKCYTTIPGSSRFRVYLYRGGDGEPLAVLEADKLGQMRTGAASGVATKYMARKNATRVGIIGTGWQARAQLEAVCSVRKIETVVAYSRNQEHREVFSREMTEKLGIGVYPAATTEEAVREMDVVITATTSKEPVFNGQWMAQGAHLNAIGSNFLQKQEIDVEAVRRSACVIVDSIEQARLESGNLERAAEAGAFYWEDVRELGAVVVGDYPGREEDSEITLFQSHGVALEDISLAGRIYDAAVKMGVGEEVTV